MSTPRLPRASQQAAVDAAKSIVDRIGLPSRTEVARLTLENLLIA
jgi:hypothetical protein